MKFVQLIADYGVGDPSFSEVIQKLYYLNPGIQVIPTSVPKFSTLATGFWTYQLSMVNPPAGLVIFTNTAPRKDNAAVRILNEGEGLVYTQLKNKVKVIGVNADYCFSFIKSDIKSLNEVNVKNKGSQFRSRDFYPEALIGIMKGDLSFVGKKLDPQLLPEVPKNKIAWIDGYGNLKTTTRKSELNLEIGRPVTITVNKVKRTAYFTDGTFRVRVGELAFAPGSSGGTDRFMEIFLRGLSAYWEFGKPAVESDYSVDL